MKAEHIEFAALAALSAIGLLLAVAGIWWR